MPLAAEVMGARTKAGVPGAGASGSTPNGSRKRCRTAGSNFVASMTSTEGDQSRTAAVHASPPGSPGLNPQ